MDQAIQMGLFLSLYNIMPSSSRKIRRTKLAKTKKQFHHIENAVARAEGSQSLSRFGHTGNDKFREEHQQHEWLHGIADKELQKFINTHYYKYDSKKVKLNVRQPITFLYPRDKKTLTRRRKK